MSLYNFLSFSAFSLFVFISVLHSHGLSSDVLLITLRNYHIFSGTFFFTNSFYTQPRSLSFNCGLFACFSLDLFFD